MAFLKVQAANNSGTGSTLDVTVSSTTANNLLVVGIDCDDDTKTITSVTDNASGGSNTYVVSTALDFSGKRMAMAYGVQVNSGATTITLTKSGSNFSRMTVIEFSGGATTNGTVFDKSSTGSGGGTNLSVTSFSPTAAGELIVAYGMINNFLVWTAGSGYTLDGLANPEQLKGEYDLSGTTTETCPMTVASDSFGWGEIAMAFNPLGSSSSSSSSSSSCRSSSSSSSSCSSSCSSSSSSYSTNPAATYYSDGNKNNNVNVYTLA